MNARGLMQLGSRFCEKVEVDASGCWLWMAQRGEDGYGRFWLDGTDLKAHRVSYKYLIGPIPKGLQLDHLCRVRHCVNPLHLQPVTSRENILRGTGTAARNAAKTHCPQGHPYDYTDGRGQRYCRTCARNRLRAWRAAQAK